MKELTLCKTFEDKDLGKLGVSITNFFSTTAKNQKEIEIINTAMTNKEGKYAMVMIYKEKVHGVPRIGRV